MNALSPTATLRTRLGIGLAIACLSLLAGCGNDLSRAEEGTTTSSEPTRTTEATGGSSTTGATTTTSATTSATDPSGADGGGTSPTSTPTGVTMPPGMTLPDGTKITLPEGVDLSIPEGLGECVDAGAALTKLSLGALGVSSTDDIDRDVATLKKAFGPGSSKDIDIVAEIARDTAKGGQINPGAAANKDYTQALENLTDRLSEVCGVG